MYQSSILVGYWFVSSCLAWPTGVEIIDLSHPFDNSTIYWPGVQHFSLESVVLGVQLQGYWYESNNYAASEHGGTHMDAPSHFAQGRWAIDEIPIENLNGPAVVVDISAKVEQNPDSEVLVSDLLMWEQRYGRIPDGAVVLMFADWSKRWPDEETYLGNADKDTKHLHFPGFSLEAVQWLTTYRNIIGVGVDTPSIDNGPSTTFPDHVHLLGLDKWGLENLNNLDKLPPTGAAIYAFPMKIRGGSGAPCRTIGVVPVSSPPSSATNMIYNNYVLFISLILLVV